MYAADDSSFSVQWDYVLLLIVVVMVFGAFFYVAYNTISNVRETVHNNLNAPIYQGKAPYGSTAVATAFASDSPDSFYG